MPKKKNVAKVKSKNGRVPPPPGLSKKAQQERIEQLRREQGEKPTGEHIIGIGRDLWKSDEEFAEFMRILRELRK